MNYFEFYDIPVNFYPDLQALRAAYIAKSKESHPDFHTLSDPLAQQVALEISTVNNIAYKTLKNKNTRIKYILTIHNLLVESKDTVPMDFLMEVMDLNEEVEEVRLSDDQDLVASLRFKIKGIQEVLDQDIETILGKWDGKNTDVLAQVKDYYLKYRYIEQLVSSL